MMCTPPDYRDCDHESPHDRSIEGLIYWIRSAESQQQAAARLRAARSRRYVVTDDDYRRLGDAYDWAMSLIAPARAAEPAEA